jgi:tRNA(fMet)-specific endonuclease VapC
MSTLLLDTSAVSILFKPDYTLHKHCFEIVAGSEWFISFMTRAELLLWPKVNRWGSVRAKALHSHIELCTTLFPDEDTCAEWSEIVAESRFAGRSITAADAWIAAAARQWDIPLVTSDQRDFEHIERLTVIPLAA